MLTDNGPEYIARAFTTAVATKGLAHRRIPARSPNHNAVCERFQGTALQECWRPAFHRRHFTSTRQLQAEIDAWLTHYNHRRRNHSDFMRGRTPPKSSPSTTTTPPPDMLNQHRALSPQPPARKH